MSLCVVGQNALLIQNRAKLRTAKSARVIMSTYVTNVMMDTIKLTHMSAKVRCSFHRITLELRYKHLSQLNTTQA